MAWCQNLSFQQVYILVFCCVFGSSSELYAAVQRWLWDTDGAADLLSSSARRLPSSSRIAGTRCQLEVEGIWRLNSPFFLLSQSWLYVAAVATWLAVQSPSPFSTLSLAIKKDSTLLSDKPVMMIAEHELISTCTSLPTELVVSEVAYVL